jgi:hypothetical protein
MKKAVLLLIFIATSMVSFSQKVKMTKEAKEKYVSQEASRDSNKEVKRAEENKMLVYAILIAESEVGADFLTFRIQESSRELATKASGMRFDELEKLTRSKFSAKSEVDVLNYLAESGWEIVAIENTTDKKKNQTKYYLKKMVSI